MPACAISGLSQDDAPSPQDPLLASDDVNGGDLAPRNHRGGQELGNQNDQVEDRSAML